jgi:hypothetical protein
VLGNGAPPRHEGGLGLFSASTNLGLGAPSNIGGLMSLQVAAAEEAPKWIFVTKRFKSFLNNLELTDVQRNDGETKFKGVVKTLNQAYWNSNSDTEPPRVLRRLFSLRGLSHEQEVKPVFPRDPRTGCSHGA